MKSPKKHFDVQWAAHQPTPNCQICLINFQLYNHAIRFKFHCEILTHSSRFMCCPLYFYLRETYN